MRRGGEVLGVVGGGVVLGEARDEEEDVEAEVVVVFESWRCWRQQVGWLCGVALVFWWRWLEVDLFALFFSLG